MSNCTKAVLLLVAVFIAVIFVRDASWERLMQCEIDNAISLFAQHPGVTVAPDVNVPLGGDCSEVDPYESFH